jgi:hypothetical protein
MKFPKYWAEINAIVDEALNDLQDGPAPFPWTVFCLRCWVIFAFICLLLGSYNAGRSGVAGVRSAGFFLGDLACP